VCVWSHRRGQSINYTETLIESKLRFYRSLNGTNGVAPANGAYGYVVTNSSSAGGGADGGIGNGVQHPNARMLLSKEANDRIRSREVRTVQLNKKVADMRQVIRGIKAGVNAAPMTHSIR
jgi:hypothetical protein